jgi:hypothetical protein
MHLAFVSNFAPDGRPPSQHGFHLVNGMRRARPDHALEVLSGRSPHADGDAIRHWDYGSPWIAQQMLAGLARLRPDAVFFNSLFTA